MPDTEAIANTITDAELDVLQQLWEQSPLTAQDIIERTGGHPSTVKTLINRLLKKGAVGFEEKHRKYHYVPAISRAEFTSLKTQSFINRFFGGEVTPLVSHFVKGGKLDDKDIEELKQLIDRMEKGHEH